MDITPFTEEILYRRAEVIISSNIEEKRVVFFTCATQVIVIQLSYQNVFHGHGYNF